MVLAIIVILASLLLPGLSKTKSKAQAIRCLNNLKQMSLSWLMYTQDHNEEVPPNSVEASSPRKIWVQGWMDLRSGSDNTNTLYLQESHLWPYRQTTAVWRCPSDVSTSVHDGQVYPRVRSYSMNSFMNPLCSTQPCRAIVKTTDLVGPPPTRTMVLIDERVESINNGVFSVDMDEARIFVWPGNSQANRSAVSFADGHCELKSTPLASVLRTTAFALRLNRYDSEKLRLLILRRLCGTPHKRRRRPAEGLFGLPLIGFLNKRASWGVDLRVA